MAKKKTKRDPKPGQKRYRRTDDELIDDLKAQIETLKQRKAARELKESPAAKQAIQAYRAVTKAIEMAGEEGEKDLKRCMTEAQHAMAGFFEEKGIDVPKARKPRRRKVVR